MSEISEQLLILLTKSVWWSFLLRICLFFASAFLVRALAFRISRKLLSLSRAHKHRFGKHQMRHERLETIQQIVASFVTIFAFLIAFIASLTLFVSADSIVWMTGLFAGGLGFGLMPLIRDFFTGVTFLFEDPFDVGEKVEILAPTVNLAGVIENVNLRTTLLRMPTGELYHIPNGEIRIVRNFSRGLFSSANITLELKAKDLQTAIDCLENSSDDALLALPNLIEPWLIVSEGGELSQTVKLKLVAKAKYGKAGDMRPRLLAFVQKILDQSSIELI